MREGPKGCNYTSGPINLGLNFDQSGKICTLYSILSYVILILKSSPLDEPSFVYRKVRDVQSRKQVHTPAFENKLSLTMTPQWF